MSGVVVMILFIALIIDIIVWICKKNKKKRAIKKTQRMEMEKNQRQDSYEAKYSKSEIVIEAGKVCCKKIIDKIQNDLEHTDYRKQYIENKFYLIMDYRGAVLQGITYEDIILIDFYKSNLERIYDADKVAGFLHAILTPTMVELKNILHEKHEYKIDIAERFEEDPVIQITYEIKNPKYQPPTSLV